MFEFFIEGKPVAKTRPRFGRCEKGVQTYDLQSKVKANLRINIAHQMARKGVVKPVKDILSVEMTFATALPDSWSKKRKESLLEKHDPRRPDLDNYVKMYLDVMNGLVYKDDNQVAEIFCKKIFSNQPSVKILIKKVNDSSTDHPEST